MGLTRVSVEGVLTWKASTGLLSVGAVYPSALPLAPGRVYRNWGRSNDIAEFTSELLLARLHGRVLKGSFPGALCCPRRCDFCLHGRLESELSVCLSQGFSERGHVALGRGVSEDPWCCHEWGKGAAGIE